MNRGNTWICPAGASQTYTVTIRDGSGAAITSTYAGTEALTATLWEGAGLAAIGGVLNASWHTAASGTVDVTVSPGASQEAGYYRVRLSVTFAGQTSPFYEGWLQVQAIAASATESPVYCTYQDLMDKAGDWLVRLMQSAAGDQTNFDQERAQSRQWLDDIIIGASRPYSYAWDLNYALSYGSMPWGPVETPDTVVRAYLVSNLLIVRAKTIEACVYKSLELICEKRVTFDADGESYRLRARYYRLKAANALRSYRPEIDTNADGMADISFNLGVVSFR